MSDTEKDSRIQVVNGKLQITSKNAQELFHEYKTDFWSRQLVTVGLSGNRQALMAKMQLYERYISLPNEQKNQESFHLLAKKMGYRLEAIQELWNDFVTIYQPEFIQWLKDKVNPPKTEEKSDVLEF